jgi:putative ABC transport system permease protein
MEGFYLLQGHAKTESGNPEAPEDGSIDSMVPPRVREAINGAEPNLPSRLDETRAKLKPLPIPQREVTSILLRTSDGLMTLGLKNEINEGSVAQAVLPIQEISLLFSTFVQPIQAAFLLFTSLICLISGVSILVSIYNSMNDRRHEIAVMRALGASRNTVMSVVLLESVLLALGGGLLGWLGGHVLVGGVLGQVVEDRTGVSIGIFDVAPPVSPWEMLGLEAPYSLQLSPELLLIPALILLAILVGLIPALAAYRTDVSKSLASTP